jgi:hypothetical protein
MQHDRPLDLPFSLDAQRSGVLIARHLLRVVPALAGRKINMQEFNEDENYV